MAKRPCKNKSVRRGGASSRKLLRCPTAHRSAEERTLPEAAGALTGPVHPGGLEAGGCSEPWRWGAYEDWKGVLSGTEMAGMEGAAEREAFGP